MKSPVIHRKQLGQYMTPEAVADIVAHHISADTECVVDLTAGDCSLLRAVRRKLPSCALVGCEIDPFIHSHARRNFPSAKLICGNGLTARLAPRLVGYSKIGIVGNPPFIETSPSGRMERELRQAFPGLTSRLGMKRLELYFLARALLLAKRHDGVVAIVMPIGFADGDVYSQYRRELLANYRLLHAIEIPENVFDGTEARTILLVLDTAKAETSRIKVSYLDADSGKVKSVYQGLIASGERLDARYWGGRIDLMPHTPRLQDIGVTITRGRYSRKVAETLATGAIHTTDLGRVQNGSMSIAKQVKVRGLHKNIDSEIARPGDILLSRTGSRVTWRPVIVCSGTAPITDHVFRIRAPEEALNAVWEAFRHPSFDRWLRSMAKGVCATVLTKRELLTMPLFR
jgi:N-6 DNA Methylase